MDDTQFLPRLVDCLDRSRDDGFGWSNELVRVENVDDEGFDLGMLDLDDHPVCFLRGFTAPPSWRVIGIVGCAWAGPMAAPGERQVRPSAHPDAVRIRMTTLTARSGARAGRIRRSTGEVTDVDGGEGLIPDCLSRAMGLATPPAPVPAQHFLAVRWLEEVLAGAPADLPETLPPGAGWDVIQRRLIAGEWRDDYGLTSDEVTWMDTGMLARWVLADHPPLEALLRQLDATLGPVAARWARAEVTRLLRAA